MPVDTSNSGVKRNSPEPLLRLNDIQKSFPGVMAISSASLDVQLGEIHALVGENGAGKSTLIKVVTGAHQPDSGTIKLYGKPQQISSPISAYQAGIAAIYQEFNLVPALSIRENLFLGREVSRLGVINTKTEYQLARQVFKRLNVDLNPDTPVRDLSIANQQLVEIARALLANTRLLILDEPTAALTPPEVKSLFEILQQLRSAGQGIVFISHRLDEVFELADRITIMRDGKTLDTWEVGKISRNELIQQMVGRPLDQEFPKVAATLGSEHLVVEGLCGGIVEDVCFSVREGEVLGFAGLVGSGRTDVARLLFGADKRTAGTVLLGGQKLKINNPRDAINNGICLLTEDRKSQGLVLALSARDNFALGNLDRWSSRGWINRGLENARFLHFVDSLKIKISGPDQIARHLSGGNQQKLLVARWLEKNTSVVVFDEPTRGIDVGARYEMYLLINELAARGKAIIVISSELPEILGMSDRVLVMHEGKIRGEIYDVKNATQEQIMELAVK